MWLPSAAPGPPCWNWRIRNLNKLFKYELLLWLLRGTCVCGSHGGWLVKMAAQGDCLTVRLWVQSQCWFWFFIVVELQHCDSQQVFYLSIKSNVFAKRSIALAGWWWYGGRMVKQLLHEMTASRQGSWDRTQATTGISVLRNGMEVQAWPGQPAVPVSQAGLSLGGCATQTSQHA